MTEPRDKLSRKLHPRRGIVINYVSYWSEMLEDRSLYGRNLQVRIDPYDASTVWVQTHGIWTECHSRDYVRMKGVSFSTVKSAAQEFRKKRKSMRAFSQKYLADFLDQQERGSKQGGYPVSSEGVE